MTTVEITVTELSFPPKLEDKFCRFRPLLSLRYRDSTGKPVFARAALPGLGERDFWDCELKHKNDSVFVRDPNASRVDMERIPIMQRQVTFNDLDLKSFDRMDLEIFDIDTKPGWKKTLEKALETFPPEVLLAFQPEIPAALMLVKTAVEKGTGHNLADLETDLLNKLIGKKDGLARSLWARSEDLKNTLPPTLNSQGAGIQGDYSLTLKMEAF